MNDAKFRNRVLKAILVECGYDVGHISEHQDGDGLLYFDRLIKIDASYVDRILRAKEEIEKSQIII